MTTVSYDFRKLEGETIELRRFSSLAYHLAVNYDAGDPENVSRLAFATELLANKADALIEWLESNETMIEEAKS